MSEPQLRTGQVIGGRFVLGRKLGSGGFGSVWLADDTHVRQQVALKLLHDKFLDNTWVLDRFEREAEVLGRLVHPGISRPEAWQITEDYAFLAMEYVPGESLDIDIAAHAERDEPYSDDRLLGLMRPLCEAVDYAHGMEVVHRDLKPKNVQLTGDGGLKVLDFGVAKLLSDSSRDATTVGRLLGSLLYMSPEQAISAPVDRRADIFSLGTILFELLTLRRAWAWDSNSQPIWALDKPIRRDAVNNHMSILRRIATAPRPLPSGSRPGLSPRIDEVVTRAMATAPRDRFRSAATLLGAFEAALGAPVMPSARTSSDLSTDTLVDAPARPAHATLPDTPRGVMSTEQLVRVDPEGSDAEDFTTVMPKDQDARDLVRGGTRAHSESPTHAVGMSSGNLSPDTAIPPYMPAVASGTLPRQGGMSPGVRQLVTLTVGVALGAVIAVVALWQRPSPAPAPSVIAPEPAGLPTAVGTAAHPKSAPVVVERAAPPPKPAPAKVTRKTSKPTRAAKPARKPALAGVAPLRRMLAKARANPDDAHLIESLGTKIQAAAKSLDDDRVRLTIERRATMSAMAGDLDGLGACIDALAKASR